MPTNAAMVATRRVAFTDLFLRGASGLGSTALVRWAILPNSVPILLQRTSALPDRFYGPFPQIQCWGFPEAHPAKAYGF